MTALAWIANTIVFAIVSAFATWHFFDRAQKVKGSRQFDDVRTQVVLLFLQHAVLYAVYLALHFGFITYYHP